MNKINSQKNYISLENKIFVAGHNGMVGSSICRKLEAEGYKNILRINKASLDLRNSSEVENWFKINKPDVVINAAGKVGGILSNIKYPGDFLMDNLKIQNNLIDSSLRFNVKRFLFIATSSIYPKNIQGLIKEDDLMRSNLEETNEYYSTAKIAGIKLCEAFRRQFGFDSITVIPANLYGIGDKYHEEDSHVLPSLIRKFHLAKSQNLQVVNCWGTGSPIREFLYVDDLSEACLFLLEKWKPLSGKRNFINVGVGNGISIKELSEIIAKEFKFQGHIQWDLSKPDGMTKKVLNVEKINNLGWRSKMPIEIGIRKSIKDFDQRFSN